MFRKLVLIFLAFNLFIISNAVLALTPAEDAQATQAINAALGTPQPYVGSTAEGQQLTNEIKTSNTTTSNGVNYTTDNESKAKEETAKAVKARDDACEKSGDCLDKPNFMVPVSGMFNFGGSSKIGGSNAQERINNTFGYVIQKMMIALGIISLFIMTIGAGYIIIYHGQDDLLGKGKNIFIAGVTSLVIALSSYYIVSLVRYLIFTT